MPPPPSTPAMSAARRDVENRLTPLLATSWTAVPDALMAGMAWLQWEGRDKPRSLRASHFLLIVYLLSAKWDERDPHPTLKSIESRSGLSYRTLLDALRDLEEAGWVRTCKARTIGGTNRTHDDLSGLLSALKRVHQEMISPKQRPSSRGTAP